MAKQKMCASCLNGLDGHEPKEQKDACIADGFLKGVIFNDKLERYIPFQKYVCDSHADMYFSHEDIIEEKTEYIPFNGLWKNTTVYMKCPSGFESTVRLELPNWKREMVRVYEQEGGNKYCQILADQIEKFTEMKRKQKIMKGRT